MKFSLSAAWDETKAILGRDGRLYAAIALALIVLPGVILSLSVPEGPPDELPSPGPWVAVLIVSMVISIAGQLALIRMAVGPQLSVAEAIAHGLRRLLPYLGAVLIWSVPAGLVGYLLFQAAGPNPAAPRPAAMLGLLLWLIAVLFIIVRLLLAPAVASAEQTSPMAILRRSWAASRGNWWRLFAFTVLFGIAVIILLTVVEVVVGSIAAATLGTGPWTVGTLVVAIASQLVSAALSIVFFVMLARIYVQLSGRDTVEHSS
ncbi:MAG: hypothetical protein ABIS39_05660 [Sphingomicrobium sp.]